MSCNDGSRWSGAGLGVATSFIGGGRRALLGWPVQGGEGLEGLEERLACRFPDKVTRYDEQGGARSHYHATSAPPAPPFLGPMPASSR